MFKRNPIEARVETEIHNLLDLMDKETGYTDDYKAMNTQMTKLLEIYQGSKISKDTWVTVGTHVAGLIVILGHERTHIIASKAFSFVKKIV